MKPLPDNINPGILHTVKWLRSHGFDTVDSGDGKTHSYECDLLIPYVYMRVNPPDKIVSELRRLHSLLSDAGVELEIMNRDNTAPCIQCSWDASDTEGMGMIAMFNVIVPESKTIEDDFGNEPLGPACSREDGPCESCQ